MDILAIIGAFILGYILKRDKPLIKEKAQNIYKAAQEQFGNKEIKVLQKKIPQPLKDENYAKNAGQTET